ncbi:MAG: hypothetical protein ACRDOU_04180 [Streptosporangiaceae bacterium]
MRGQIGLRGLGILLIAGLIGLALAIVGWSQRDNGLVAPSVSRLTVSVTRQADGIAVRAGVAGQPLPPAQFYEGGGKVYMLESNLGDDGGNLDYDLGDDALIVTNLQGRIVL